jgi:alginate O-acetyltransferase complex protein AlgI
MLFNSLAFAFFLPVVFGAYWWLGRAQRGLTYQNILLLAASYFFYGWWDVRFLALLAFSTTVDFFVGKGMGAAKTKAARSWLLATTIFLNLGMLCTFKYFDFFSQSLQFALASIGVVADLPLLKIMLPVGISFYTFQSLSYGIMVYRRKLEPARDPIAFYAFVSFFPQLVAGPIEKASDLLPQFYQRRKFDYPLAVTGLRLILWGIFKKVVIADALSPYVGYVFGQETTPHAVDVLLATVFFCIQIYCDFSGYSDIAMGTARLFGFRLSLNFRRPYFAKTLQDFWARWHISLTSWFRDYLYIPLGGNQKGVAMQYINIMIVFLVSGLWHGAAFTFIVWGAIHGSWYINERILNLPKRLPTWLSRFFTLGIVAYGFIYFRAGTWAVAKRMQQGLVNWEGDPLLFAGIEKADLSLIWPVGIVLLYFAGLIGFLLVNEGLFDFSKVGDRFDGLPRWGKWLYYYVLIGWLLLLGAYGTPVQFIYFQF